VKGNIGHLDAAAGIAGLIKAVLALRHRYLPASPHFRRANPELRLEGSPFAVLTEGRPWPAGDAPRIAGVSSFGIGGTNVHCLLQEAPAAPPDPAALPVQLLPLSAASPAALTRSAEALSRHLASAKAPALASVAWTLQNSRRDLRCRLAVAAHSPDEAIERLRDALAEESAEAPGGPVFLFPGQGTQHAGMAAGLVQALPEFRAELEAGCAKLAELGVELRPWLRAPRDDAEANRQLTATDLAQPALFLVETALARLLLSWGVTPAACLGHSVGEYAAATVAGVLDFDEALRLVVARGRILQALPAGAMLSVRLGEEAARRFLVPGVEVAAINAPDLVVLAGPAAALAATAAAIGRAGGLCRPLATSHAFHSAAMEPALAPFGAALRQATLRAPALPLASNVTGSWLQPAEAGDADFWTRQLRQPVRFSAGLQTLLAAGHRRFLELGPGSALSTMVLRHGTPALRPLAWPTLAPASAAPGDDLTALLRALGGLWTGGQSFDWRRLWPRGTPQRVSLPPYPFERQRHWIGPAAAPPAATLAAPAVAAPTSAEAAVIALWQRHLGHEGIGRDDDFHRLGGDSLLAVRIAAELRAQFGSDLQPHELLTFATPRRLAERLAGSTGLSATPFCRVPLRQGDPVVAPLVLFHAVGGTVNLYAELAAALDPRLPVLAYQSASLDGRTPADRTVEEMAARYLADLRTLQPQGPYRLAGSSFGGMVAFEAARQLAIAGEAVSPLALLDAPGPGDLPRELADDAEVLSYIGTLLGHPLAAATLRPLTLEAQIARFLEAAAPSLPPGITPAEFARYLAAFKSNTAAMRRYAPPPWPASPPILFFKAATRDAHTPPAPEAAWRRLLPGTPIEVVTVPGTHLSMLSARHLGPMASRLATALR